VKQDCIDYLKSEQARQEKEGENIQWMGFPTDINMEQGDSQLSTTDRGSIPIIDLFAGPGGLGEGFSRAGNNTVGKEPLFDIKLSVEKDPTAYGTLLLRSFFRKLLQNENEEGLEEYYDFIHSYVPQTSTAPAYVLIKEFIAQYPEGEQALQEVLNSTLGIPEDNADVENRIAKILDEQSNKPWILIGGPPCQAYSIAGRVRMKHQESFKEDVRHTLYIEYLNILRKFQPDIFVMENVKGILSSKHDDESIFDKILKDLRNEDGHGDGEPYRVFSLVTPPPASSSVEMFDHFEEKSLDPTDFVIESQQYGIPQSRHRVILLGIKNSLLESFDLSQLPLLKKHDKEEPVEAVIDDLPPLRSGLSLKEDIEDSDAAWLYAIQQIAEEAWLNGDSTHDKADTDSGLFDSATWDSTRDSSNMQKTLAAITDVVKNIKTVPEGGKGGGGQLKPTEPVYEKDWYTDSRLLSILNHESRAHIIKDLHRYMFVSCFGQVSDSPKLVSFPADLLPKHENVKSGSFVDRFRVQKKGKPATTITSHISQDGHYFIHYDPSQCRSLTVREAARIQTFPDNYLFVGARTHQYKQVGNAVPPLLAHQIADVVWKILETQFPWDR
jgi:DNA (cytosine-5)-methyltransferase 1